MGGSLSRSAPLHQLIVSILTSPMEEREPLTDFDWGRVRAAVSRLREIPSLDGGKTVYPAPI